VLFSDLLGRSPLSEVLAAMKVFTASASATSSGMNRRAPAIRSRRGGPFQHARIAAVQRAEQMADRPSPVSRWVICHSRP
jgi:hypothetical protein